MELPKTKENCKDTIKKTPWRPWECQVWNKDLGEVNDYDYLGTKRGLNVKQQKKFVYKDDIEAHTKWNLSKKPPQILGVEANENNCQVILITDKTE